MKIKTVAILLFLLLLTTTSYPALAKADMGPKPSVEITITFDGLSSGEYYATLLSKTKSTGPYSADNTYGKEPDEIDEIFSSYTDKDGFYYLHYYQKLNKDGVFKWGYYPPRDFKILVYSKQTDSFIENDQILSRYAFSSYFTADLDSGLTVQSYDYASETLKLLLRIALTIAIEIGIALLFGYRKKDLSVIIVANAVTQIFLNVALNAINYRSGSLALALNYVLYEICVFLIEAIVYSVVLTFMAKRANVKPRRIFVHVIYAFVANLASFGLGAIYLTIVGI